ncbi:MAG: hypothetical protein AABZ08_01040 [Planctomycetota bacterium]
MPEGNTKHFFPQGDGDFIAWAERFNTYVQLNFLSIGLKLSDATAVNSTLLRYRIARAAHVQARAAAAAAVAEKAESRGEFERVMRAAVRRIQGFGGTTDPVRAELGITLPDRTRTPIGPPPTRPLVKVDFSLRLTHRITFADERTPQRRSKPKGVIGAEAWVKLAALSDSPPNGPGDLRFLLLATRSPAIVEYSGIDAGKTAHYMVRWLSRRGEAGPWSETASATVGV